MGDAEQQGHSHSITSGLDHRYGGIGKTQIALEYAYRHRNEYNVVWWIDSGATCGLDRGTSKLAAILQLGDAHETDLDRTRTALCRWLERERGWLLILDNADNYEAVLPYLPPTPAGHVLITSRNQRWRRHAETVQLDTWPREKSVEFLNTRAGRTDLAGAAALANELGDLPLALDQAACYTGETGISFNDYLKLYHERFKELVGDKYFKPGDYQNTVLTTWDISISAAEQESPAAPDLLRLFAFLAPEDIPRDLLTKHARALVVEHAEAFPQVLAEAIADEIEFNRAVAALSIYSLIKVIPGTTLGTNGFAVHRLVQAVTRSLILDCLPWINAGIALLDIAFLKHSDDIHQWPDCARLRPHVEAALARLPAGDAASICTSGLFSRLASYLRFQGLFSAAEPLFEKALSIRESAVRHEHQEEVAQSSQDLAELYHARGRFAEAEPLYQKALAIRENIFGENHPDVAWSCHALSNLYRAQNRYAEAERLCQKALTIFEKIEETKHVARSLEDLAGLYHAQGRFAKAEPLYKKALALRREILPEDDPDVATSFNSLAEIYRAEGRYAEAEPLCKAGLAIREKAFGPNHPDVAWSLYTLSELHHAQGCDAEAEPLCRTTLKIWVEKLGPKHPEVARALHTLAAIYHAQKRYPKAWGLYRKAWRIRKQSLGVKSVEVAWSLLDLGRLRGDQGRYTEAEPLIL